MQSTNVAQVLKVATTGWLLKQGYSSHLELGLVSWGKLRADVLAVNLKATIILVEIKSSRQDYLTDTKWESYIPFCNKMFFCFSAKVYESLKASNHINSITSKGVGVLIHDNIEGRVRVKHSAKQKLMVMKVKTSLLTRMAWRNGISKRTTRRVSARIKEHS
jgi:hypothetical protein